MKKISELKLKSKHLPDHSQSDIDPEESLVRVRREGLVKIQSSVWNQPTNEVEAQKK